MRVYQTEISGNDTERVCFSANWEELDLIRRMCIKEIEVLGKRTIHVQVLGRLMGIREVITKAQKTLKGSARLTPSKE